MFKSIFIVALFIASTQARCNLTSDTLEVVDCLSYMTRIVVAIAKNDIERVCRAAASIAQCTRGHLVDCIGAELGDAALREIISVSNECCPDRNKPKCPYRDSILRDQRCFSADSIVTLADLQKKTVAQLRPGDSVLAFDQYTMTVLPTQVISMLDYQPQRFALFKQITTVSGRQLSLSSSHLVLTGSDDYLMAKEIRDGMDIFVMNDEGELVRDRVMNVSETVKQGYVAPLTNEGTIVVNDVAASCYATIKSHRIAHAVLSPMRWWYWFFGSNKSWIETDEGVHWFPKMIYELTNYLVPSIIQK